MGDLTWRRRHRSFRSCLQSSERQCSTRGKEKWLTKEMLQTDTQYESERTFKRKIKLFRWSSERGYTKYLAFNIFFLTTEAEKIYFHCWNYSAVRSRSFKLRRSGSTVHSWLILRWWRRWVLRCLSSPVIGQVTWQWHDRCVNEAQESKNVRLHLSSLDLLTTKEFYWIMDQ